MFAKLRVYILTITLKHSLSYSTARFDCDVSVNFLSVFVLICVDETQQTCHIQQDDKKIAYIRTFKRISY